MSRKPQNVSNSFNKIYWKFSVWLCEILLFGEPQNKYEKKKVKQSIQLWIAFIFHKNPSKWIGDIRLVWSKTLAKSNAQLQTASICVWADICKNVEKNHGERVERRAKQEKKKNCGELQGKKKKFRPEMIPILIAQSVVNDNCNQCACAYAKE